jgi:transposase
MAIRKKNDPKGDALKKAGAFNPRPDKITDDLFQSSDFFDPRDMMQVKYEMLRRVREEGWSISRASVTFGFSRPSFYEAQSDFEHAGLAGFIPERRGPREAHKLSGVVLEFIESVRHKDPAMRTADLVNLIKERFGIEVHRRSIERAVSRAKKKRQR